MSVLSKVDASAKQAADLAQMWGRTENIAQTCPKLTLEIGVFFDGTLNNRFNTNSGRNIDDSYKNALSNPALLWAVYKNGAKFNVRNSCGGVDRAFRSIYVEGPGTTRGEEDDSQGYVLGMGRKSGVEARVLSGFRELLQRINQVGGPIKIRKVVLDVFGFSRGAAAARYFVNCVRARKIRYDPYGFGDYREALPAGLTVEIRFVGVFDTVAAIGKANNGNNDPVNVHVSTAQVTGEIYHLVAGNEYRDNFRLNRNWPGGGRYLTMPGAHSDVGGGYRDPGDKAPLSGYVPRIYDTKAQAENAQRRTRAIDAAPGGNSKAEAVFVREGWIYPNETQGGIIREMTPVVMTYRNSRLNDEGKQVFQYHEQTVLSRPWVQIGLSRIPLHMMHERAMKFVKGAMLPLPRTANYLIPAGLKPYEAEIRSGTLRGRRRVEVLRNYGHVSMKDGTFVDADWWGHSPSTNHIRVEYDNLPGRAR